MSWNGVLQRLSGRRPALRRVSPERARRPEEKRQRLRRVSQAGEKLTLAGAFATLLTLLVGTGLGLGWRSWIGLFALVALAVAGFVRYLLDLRPGALPSLPRDLMLAVLVLANVALLRALCTIDPGLLAFYPLSFTALVLALAWNRAFALDATLFLSAVFAGWLLVRPECARPPVIGGLVVTAGGAITAALLASHVRRRTTLARIGLQVGLVQMVLASALELAGEGRGWAPCSWSQLPLLGLAGIAVGLVVTGILPAIEVLFQTTTDVSLLELGSTQEQPLLRKLLLEAPGTYHHSYVVGLISEAAAEAVGANPLLARVGALYHDVGKLNKPDYFAENSPDARERHRSLTPEMSNLIISSHTRDGVELGAWYGLPQVILDFMTEHHGTSCMEYFLQEARKLRGDESVSEESFRYSGPRPQRIETAILMIADAVEAIARQMPDPTHQRLREMVHEVAIKRLMDHQFDDCGMTLAELSRIEEACAQVLAGIHHTRPTYPKGRPHPLDLSQPREQREAAQAAGPRRS